MVANKSHKPDIELDWENDEDLVRINFEVPIQLRNAFKAKVASEGKKVKDVLVDLMLDYLKDQHK